MVSTVTVIGGFATNYILPKDTTARPWHVLPFSLKKSMSLPPTSTSPIDTPKSVLKLQTPAPTKQSQPPLPPTSSIPAITPTRNLILSPLPPPKKSRLPPPPTAATPRNTPAKIVILSPPTTKKSLPSTTTPPVHTPTRIYVLSSPKTSIPPSEPTASLSMDATAVVLKLFTPSTNQSQPPLPPTTSVPVNAPTTIQSSPPNLKDVEFTIRTAKSPQNVTDMQMPLKTTVLQTNPHPSPSSDITTELFSYNISTQRFDCEVGKENNQILLPNA
ncbi:unnamed protein product [Orchesella dallaii]|uniref:Uncharacterized protein n=1 Tax=Orchesella dallaii TaxID=48710 RepID=A0ABP1RRR2_9HEXA